jgi:hypothetical protein
MAIWWLELMTFLWNYLPRTTDLLFGIGAKAMPFHPSRF